ncbi:MAG: C1 family peptidase [Kiritimatiellaeota bacterium]|nr:C1 family peptidase [Kiritimatiellota bacterium]
MIKKNIRWYGWVRDQVDERDLLFRARAPARLPAAAAVRAEWLPQVWNQQALGSCTAHGSLGCAWVAILKKILPQRARRVGEVRGPDMLSRLMLYWLARDRKAVDSGAQIRVAIKCLAKQGACREELWPYDIKKFAVRPPPACWTDALLHQALKYERIPDCNLQAMKAGLAGGQPFVFGFTVYRQFEGAQCAKDGIVRLPGRKESLLGAVGGHCVYAIGYDDAKEMPDGKGAIRCRNSWGGDWGLNGDFWLPYDYLTSGLLSSDFWRIDVMET